MNRQKAKQEILKYLSRDPLERIWQKVQIYPKHHLINTLFIALCHRHDKVKWHAVYCFGRVVPLIADNDPEAARIIMRRFLWSLNDESGGIGWGAPEAMAEIMCHSNLLRQEFLHMLISYMREDGEKPFQDGNYIEHPMLQRGVLWGVGRMCSKHRGEMLEKRIEADLFAYLESQDMHLGSLALWCLDSLDIQLSADLLEKFITSDLAVTIFIDNAIQILKVSELAKQIVEDQ